MKRVLLGCVVAVAALFSACENLEPQVQKVTSTVTLNTEDAVIFTANLGVDTKTYLEAEGGVYKVRWSEGDTFTVYDADDLTRSEDASLIEGAGTSTGVFTGTLKAENYVAYYGYRRNLEEGGCYPSILQYQSCQYDILKPDDIVSRRESVADFYYPMAAVSSTSDFSFKNIASVLKVSLLGDRYIESIKITPNDTSVAICGNGELVLSGDRPVLEMFTPMAGNNFIQYYVEQELDPVEPFDCYIVLPAQTYKGGFTITINAPDGYMDLTTTDDVVMEQSQLRAIPTITYEHEYTSTWSLIGASSDWTKDEEMAYEDGYWVLKNYYLDSYSEFKFRANKDWAVNFGGYNYETTPINGLCDVTSGGANMYVETAGYYDIYLDVENECVYLMETGLAPGEYSNCYSYEDLVYLPDDSYVIVEGFVFAATQRGFILNASMSYYNNEIYVYQGTDQSAYTPVIGNMVRVYAKKSTYNGLPELTPVYKVVVMDDSDYDYGYGNNFNLLEEKDFVDFYYDAYVYIKYTGRLEFTGTYYNVYVGDQRDRVGSLSFPVQDLTEFLDKNVYVEGYFIGFSGGGKYLNTALKYISLIDNESGTEDVVPGEDIEMTKAPLKLR